MFSAARRRGDNSVSTLGVDTHSKSESRKFSAVRRRGDNGVSALGVATHCSAERRRAGLHEAGRDQAGLDDACPRVQEPAGGRPQTRMSAGRIKERSSMAGPGRNASESGIYKKKRRRKHKTLRKSRSGTETLHGMSAGQTQVATMAVETLNVLTRACTGYQYEKMELENPPTDASELISLPVMSWKRFAKDYDGRIEQLCILSERERMTSEAEELRQLFAGSATESEDTLSAKTKKERFEEQSWDSLKLSPYYEILREHKDVLPDEIPAELPQDREYSTRLISCRDRSIWPLPREQVKAIDDFFESRRKAGQVRESKSPHSAPTFCVKKPQGG
ncbi:reverse transcriptase [Phytophthora megakarya]|uniref:Reverse transcriptase n=1 Tax=Phytophthora megakarya TaxID=4795 RepID=A0A225UKR6_9STRA|nr:reverse transcriptase [Phytophthora megakarya]